MKLKEKKKFSEGFMNDIADILDYCIENETNCTEIIVNLDVGTLKIEMIFSADVDINKMAQKAKK